MTTFVDQSTGGPGVQPPEGPPFIAGSPLSPMTPYDTFSSAPMTPGVVGIAQFSFSQTYTGRKLRANFIEGLAAVDGSSTNAAYWSDSLLPLFNPHLGSQRLGYRVAFPTHAGQDDVAVLGGSLPVSVSLGSVDGSWLAKGGWFDLTQSDRFVFVQPALTNVTPSIGLQTAESLGNGPPAIASWPSPSPGLPLDGVDFVGHRGLATLELSSGALPALPGTSAHLDLGSVVIDHGEGTRWSVEALRVNTKGSISTTTLFGANPVIVSGPQGHLPTSTLGAQQETMLGLRAAFHILHEVSMTAEWGRS